MTQRYKIITQIRPTLSGVYDTVAIAVPDDQGEFVLYDDHMQDLESIGAGGVSGRITQKTIEEHRAEFDAHWHDIQSHGIGNGWPGVAWAAWKAARGIRE